MSETLNILWKESRTLAPSDFLDHIQGDPRFRNLYNRGTRQQDMVEAFEVIVSNYLGETTPFDFRIHNFGCCGSCGLTQPLGSGPELLRFLQVSIEPSAHTLEFLLNLHFRPEKWTAGNLWTGCDHGCPPVSSSTKSSRLESPPPILVIQLKRFSCSLQGKVTYVRRGITYPLKLKMGRYFGSAAAAADVSYELVAVGRHQGDKLDGGHYFTWAKHHDTSDWHEFNDNSVSPLTCDPTALTLEHQAYMFFYVRSQ